MNENIRYLPWVEEQIIAHKIVQLAWSIKRDIWRYLSYKERLGENTKIWELHEKCRIRILKKLSVVSQMQEDSMKSDTEWKSILKDALSRVYKHGDSEEFQAKLRELFDEYELDKTSTKVHFLRAYMKIVARIPENQLSLPFHC